MGLDRFRSGDGPDPAAAAVVSCFQSKPIDIQHLFVQREADLKVVWDLKLSEDDRRERRPRQGSGGGAELSLTPADRRSA